MHQSVTVAEDMKRRFHSLKQFILIHKFQSLKTFTIAVEYQCSYVCKSMLTSMAYTATDIIIVAKHVPQS